jgi:hypothetical protein
MFDIDTAIRDVEDDNAWSQTYELRIGEVYRLTCSRFPHKAERYIGTLEGIRIDEQENRLYIAVRRAVHIVREEYVHDMLIIETYEGPA